MTTTLAPARRRMRPAIDIARLYDQRNYGMDGLELLRAIPSNSIPYVIFDPQYDHLLAAMKYGYKTGEGRQVARKALHQQDAMDIWNFGQEIQRLLVPSGHVSLWMDTYILAATLPLDIFTDVEGQTEMHQVDLITWDKVRMGMGARSRHQGEFLMTFQKSPKRAKGIWKDHSIRDVWREEIVKTHPHSKPVGLQTAMIECLTEPGDTVVDATAGGFSTMISAHSCGRRFPRLRISRRDRSGVTAMTRAEAQREAERAIRARAEAQREAERCRAYDAARAQRLAANKASKVS